METLDKCFENVCELDLIFHMDKVNWPMSGDLLAHFSVSHDIGPRAPSYVRGLGLLVAQEA